MDFGGKTSFASSQRFLGTVHPDPTEVPATVERNDSEKCFIEN